jgi:hypothetical protein
VKCEIYTSRNSAHNRSTTSAFTSTSHIRYKSRICFTEHDMIFWYAELSEQSHDDMNVRGLGSRGCPPPPYGCSERTFRAGLSRSSWG